MPYNLLSMMRFIYTFFSFLFIQAAIAQKTATLNGKVVDENNKPLVGVSIEILGKQKGGITNDSGFFKISLTPNRVAGIVFSYVGYFSTQKNITLSLGETEFITVTLKRNPEQLEEVVVKDKRGRRDVSADAEREGGGIRTKAHADFEYRLQPRRSL